MKRHSPSRGFTLIELLVVIAIMAVLAALAFGALGKSREKADAVTCASNLRTLGTMVNLYLQDNNGEYPWVNTSLAPAGTPPTWWAALAPYYGVTQWDQGLRMGKCLRCPTHNAVRAKIITSYYKTAPDFGMNFLVGRGYPATVGGVQVPRPGTRSIALKRPSEVMLATEAAFTAGGIQPFIDTYWLGGTTTPVGGGYKTGGVHAGHNNVLYVDGHVAPLQVVPPKTPTRYTTPGPWDPIWGHPSTQ